MRNNRTSAPNKIKSLFGFAIPQFLFHFQTQLQSKAILSLNSIIIYEAQFSDLFYFAVNSIGNKNKKKVYAIRSLITEL